MAAKAVAWLAAERVAAVRSARSLVRLEHHPMARRAPVPEERRVAELTVAEPVDRRAEPADRRAEPAAAPRPRR